MPRIQHADQRTTYIGVDPGKTGGVAFIYTTGVVLHPMPDGEFDVYGVFELCPNHCIAVIEKVGGYAGGPGQPGSAMFNFGANYGGLRMAMFANDIPFEEVTPRTWQKALGIRSRKKGEGKTQWKNRLKSVAQRLFPNVKGITLKTCDALLIAEFCKRKHTGVIK